MSDDGTGYQPEAQRLVERMRTTWTLRQIAQAAALSVETIRRMAAGNPTSKLSMSYLHDAWRAWEHQQATRPRLDGVDDARMLAQDKAERIAEAQRNRIPIWRKTRYGDCPHTSEAHFNSPCMLDRDHEGACVFGQLFGQWDDAESGRRCWQAPPPMGPPPALPKANHDQPPPQGGGKAVWPLVKMEISHLLEDMDDRDMTGRERYGQPLRVGDGRDHLKDAYQELLDAAVYLRSCIETPAGTRVPQEGGPPVFRAHTIGADELHAMYGQVIAMALRLRTAMEG